MVKTLKMVSLVVVGIVIPAHGIDSVQEKPVCFEEFITKQLGQIPPLPTENTLTAQDALQENFIHIINSDNPDRLASLPPIDNNIISYHFYVLAFEFAATMGHSATTSTTQKSLLNLNDENRQEALVYCKQHGLVETAKLLFATIVLTH